MRHANDMFLRSLSSEASGRFRDFNAVYDSDVDAQLRAYDSSIKQGVHAISASLSSNLEIFVVMMPLPIPNGIVLLFIVLLHNKSTFPLFIGAFDNIN